MTTASTISALFGKITGFPLLKRGKQPKHRFLCPNCLQFGGFAYACGECWSELPEYANGKNTQTCPRCQRSLLSADEDVVRAYCQQCKANCDRTIYHQREVHVLATLRYADSQSLYRAISGQWYQPQGGRGCVYDDGVRLAYVLNLSDFTNETHPLPEAHALLEVKSIWLNVSVGGSKEFALELGEVADRFIAQAKLAEAQRQAMTVCVYQDEFGPVMKSILKTRFGEVRYGVTVSAFLCGRTRIKVIAQGEIGHNSTVPALIAELKDSNLDVRYRAAENLGVIGNSSAVPALSTALKDSESVVRGQAAEALGNIGDSSAVPILIIALNDRESDVCERVTAALVKIGKPAVPALIAALRDSNWSVRERASQALVKIGKSAAPGLIAVLGDSEVYRYVSSVLIKIGEAETLIKIGELAVPALIAALKDSNWSVRERASQALVKIGEPAVPALITALKDSESDVRYRAAETLGTIGSDTAMSALIVELKDNRSDVRYRAAQALGAIGNDTAVSALIGELRDSESGVRYRATQALIKIGEPAVPALIDALKHSGTDVHKCVAEVLKAIGVKAAIPALEVADRECHS